MTKPHILKAEKNVIGDVGWIQQYKISLQIADHKLLALKSGAVYGIHYQLPQMEQNKIISVLRGITFHVAVEMIRGEALQFTLMDGEALYVPRGWAHGLFVMQNANVHICVDQPYSDLHARGIGWNKLALKWIDGNDVYPENYLSQDDRWPDFETARQEYTEWTLKKSTTNS